MCTLGLPAELPAALAISEVAELTGVSAHTLRYYERIGLVEVGRDPGGRRIYDRDALGRVVFITGCAARTCRSATLPAHRQSIVRRLQELQAALAVIDYKIVTYGGNCAP